MLLIVDNNQAILFCGLSSLIWISENSKISYLNSVLARDLKKKLRNKAMQLIYNYILKLSMSDSRGVGLSFRNC